MSNDPNRKECKPRKGGSTVLPAPKSKEVNPDGSKTTNTPKTPSR